VRSASTTTIALALALAGSLASPGPASGKAGAPAAGATTIAPRGPTEEPGGFRMSSDPKVITVFGDTAQFREYVDRFYVLHGQMQTARETFSRDVQLVVATLAAHAEVAKGKARCPVDAIALAYARAFHNGQTYHMLGKELEAQHTSIEELDDLGETAGLTPDYRWRVTRALKLYPQVLRDFREMKVAFQEQLAAELQFAGCDAGQLVAKGDELQKSGAAPETVAMPAPPPAKLNPRDKVVAPVSATTVTFFVDNATCEGAMRVYVDGLLVGEVGGRAKAAFRAASGRHDMCLVQSSKPLQCGDPGTLRKAYIHDGWSVMLRCD
jgi:hypothetical protein